MEKRGQLTVFIIISIVLIGGIALFFIFKGRGNFSDLRFSEISDIKSFVEECVKDAGEEAVYEVGIGGGYFFPPKTSNSDKIPYYYINGKNLMPMKEDVEREISLYANRKLTICSKNLENLEDFDIENPSIKVKTKIELEEVVFNIVSSIKVSKAGTTSVIEEFGSVRIPVRAGIVYDSIYEIMKEQEGKNTICMSCILDVASKNDIEINLVEIGNGEVLFIVTDNHSKINDQAFNWIFVNKYQVI